MREQGKRCTTMAVVLSAAVGLLGWCPVEAGAGSATSSASEAGGAGPALVVETLDHGRFDLAEQRGSWVVVNFWATWCSPCLKEIPDLTRFDAAREDVRVIGLAYEEISAPDMRAFLERHPAGYPIAIVDVYAPPAGLATPRGLPTTHLVAPDGRLVRSFLGPVTSADLSQAIDAAGAAAGTGG